MGPAGQTDQPGRGSALERSATGPFINRERELAVLVESLGSAVEGTGRLALLTGEGGIGKTRLVEQLIARSAPAERVAVVWGRCWDSEGAPSMWPWTGVLRELLATRDRAELEAQLGPGGAWLAQFVPELSEALPDRERELDSEQSRFVLFDALAQFLRRVSADRPLVVVLDDIHAADRLSLLALLFLARQLSTMRLLVIATWRGFSELRDPTVAGIVTKLSRLAEQLHVGGLDAEDVGRLIAERGAVQPDRAVADALHRATGGNPFFADEVVRMLGDDRLSRGGEVLAMPLPTGVRSVIEERLEALSSEAVELLRGAAVIGGQFSLATLARARNRPRGELRELLEPALEAHLLVPVPEEPASFRFAHDLIRETAYAGLKPLERSLAHAAVGEALVERYEGVTELHVQELAHHFLEALPAGDPRAAVDYARRAADRAYATFAHESAARLYSSALDALELVDGLHRPERTRLRAELLLGLGRSRLRSGEPRARETLLEAAAVARLAEDPRLLAEVALAFGAFALSPGLVDRELTELLEEALARVGHGDRATRVRLLGRLARALYWAPGTQRQLALIEEAVELARSIGDDQVLAVALGNGIVAMRSPDTVELELAWIDELLSLQHTPGDVAVAARSIEIDLLLEGGALTAADAALDALERHAERLRDVRARPFVPVHRTRRAVMEGRFDEAERQLAVASEVAADLEDSTFPLTIGGARFIMRLLQGQPEAHESEMRALAEARANMPVWSAAVAVISLALGQRAEAQRLLERLTVSNLTSIPRDNMWTITVALLAQACAELGDADRARLLYDALAPFESRTVISPISGYMGPVSRYMGLLALTFGDRDEGLKRLRGALELARRHQTTPMVATIAVDLAEALSGESDGEARALLSEAKAITGSIELPGVAARIERLAADGAGLTPVPPEDVGRPAAHVSAVAPGSARLELEGDVWSFVFDGRTVRTRDSKGVRHLALLLSRPGVEVHSLELSGGIGETVSGGVAGELAATDVGVGSGPALDAAAKSAYRRRLEDLRDELDEAERFNDPERAARAREEIDFLAAELSSAVGLGGRDRPQGSDAERARVNVTRAIRSTIRRLAEHDEALGAELEATIHTGLFCRYQPDPRRPLKWDVR